MNAIEVMEEIQEIAKKNQSRQKEQKVRLVLDLKTGECYRQGDLYVFKVDDSHEVGEEIQRDQLADGESIGQRHMLTGKFKIYKGAKAPQFIGELHKRVCLGYAFDILEEGAINTHPEHDHYKFLETGRYQVMHQADLRTLRRAAD